MQDVPSTTQSRKQQWQKTQYSNLVRYGPSGTYFARVRVEGKLIRKSLDTSVLSVARLRLGDFIKEQRALPAKKGENLSLDALAAEFLQQSETDYNLKPRTREYHHECVAMLKRCDETLFPLSAAKITKSRCEDLARKLASHYSATRFNGIISTLRGILNLAIDKGIRYDNPASGIQQAKVRQKQLKLPSQAQFEVMLDALGSLSPEGAVLVQFLAYSGCRIDEARHIKWGDILKEEILVKGDPITHTKNSEVRRVPIIQPMRELLDAIWPAKLDPDQPVLKSDTCRKGLSHACEAAGCSRITHHDLRHLFATRCIESGVDIPTVSRWLGHKDGGALAMKVYGHLRNEHSVNMAKKVTFGTTPQQPDAA